MANNQIDTYFKHNPRELDRPGCNKQYFLGSVVLNKHQRRDCAKVYHKYYQIHSTYFSMGNYRVKAKLMIGDGDDDDDNDDDDVSLACQEHANGFGNCALLQFASFQKQESCFVVWQTFGAAPRLSAALTKNKTFHKFQNHVERTTWRHLAPFP